MSNLKKITQRRQNYVHRRCLNLYISRPEEWDQVTKELGCIVHYDFVNKNWRAVFVNNFGDYNNFSRQDLIDILDMIVTSFPRKKAA